MSKSSSRDSDCPAPAVRGFWVCSRSLGPAPDPGLFLEPSELEDSRGLVIWDDTSEECEQWVDKVQSHELPEAVDSFIPFGFL